MKRTCVLLASWATTTAAVASGAVTCTTTAAQLVTNPSFEDGTTGWTIQTGSSYDTFVYSLAPDGRSVLALNGDLNNVLSQPISNMVVGETYTVSWYWQLLAVATGQCELSVTIGSQTVNTAISTSTSNQAAWLPGTGAYTATASSALLELSLACTSGSFSSYSEVNFDDITVTGPNTETCSTAAVTPISTPTLTPTPSSSVASSSALAILTKSSSAAVNIVSLSVATGSSASILPSSAISSACIQYAIQVVQNPSFESGLTDWTFNVEPATIEAVEGNAEDGIYVLSISWDSPTTSNLNFHQDLINLDPNSIYDFSMWFSASYDDQIIGTLSYSAWAQSGCDDETTLAYSSANTNGAWAEVTGTWQPTDSTGALYIGFSFDGYKPELKLNIDNIQLVRRATSQPACASSQAISPTPLGQSSHLRTSTPLIQTAGPTTLPVAFVAGSSSAIIIPPSASVTSHVKSVTPPFRRPSSSRITHRPLSSASVSASSSSSLAPPVPSLPVGAGSSSAPAIFTSSDAQASNNITPSAATTASQSSSAGQSSTVSSAVNQPTASGTGSVIETTSITGTSSAVPLTTSTVFITQEHTITACPSSVTDCPASQRTTYITTETMGAYTTTCPVTATETAATTTISIATESAKSANLITTSAESMTTSTVYTTKEYTITACPSSVTDCPASEQKTYITTKTVEAYTTVCPVTATETGAATSLPSTVQVSAESETTITAPTITLAEQMTTSTVYTTKEFTITACPPSVIDCHASQKTAHVTTETVVAYTTVYPVTATATGPATDEATLPAVTDISVVSSETQTAVTVHLSPVDTETSRVSSPAIEPTTTTTTETIVPTIFPVDSAATAGTSSEVAAAGALHSTNSDSVEISQTQAPAGSATSAESSGSTSAGVVGSVSASAAGSSSNQAVSANYSGTSGVSVSSTLQAVVSPTTAAAAPSFNGAVGTKPTLLSGSALVALLVGYLVL